MRPRCDWLHLRYRRKVTLTTTDWICEDCGEVVASLPSQRMRGKTPAQVRRIQAWVDSRVGRAVP